MRFRVRIRPSFVLYVLSIALFSSLQRCIAVSVALLVHELGHCIAAKATGEKIAQLEITPFGGMMTYAKEKPPYKGIRGVFCAVSGPAANYFFILLVSHGRIFADFSPLLFRELITSNLVMIVMNMIPALPLDGGQVVFCIGYYLFPVSTLITILTYIGMTVGVLFLALGMYGIAIRGILNFSLFVIGGYLIAAANRCRGFMIAENIYAILHEKKADLKPVQALRVYRVLSSASLFSLMRYVDPAQASAFVTDKDPAFIAQEDILLQYLLKSPNMTIGEAVNDIKAELYGDKSCFCP